MVQLEGGRWRTTSVNLRMLAVRFGVLDDYLDQLSRNRYERAAWHAVPDVYDAHLVRHCFLPDEDKPCVDH
ncbi:hypothetical protein [Paenarthrobacter ureafaciens]|uniref:hypothetical protein n=1 Tax=Paenarthrobacter ureafaciens TaxID=37931 RepID=UPI002264E1B4|nr:hypothetical protein [Paenarthrobacter ureafaciens]MCX8456546.1 hypothetical protein [Paenarthrobacter ureafaciens]MCY0974409.1 hypothetical protein [Paenarthrobacter ureafaciens]